MPEDDIERVQAYCSRHQRDFEAPGFRRGEDGYPSPGRVARGGDTGKRWVEQRRVDDL
ncbi:hypothetical protein [Agrococcus sp. TSP3-2-1]|uniref:hypothetical protein n=1 Tax=Agrococcus sp. TSP3-2-1 TaxID=2804583 RepID=UPI003CE86B20